MTSGRVHIYDLFCVSVGDVHLHLVITHLIPSTTTPTSLISPTASSSNSSYILTYHSSEQHIYIVQMFQCTMVTSSVSQISDGFEWKPICLQYRLQYMLSQLSSSIFLCNRLYYFFSFFNKA